MLTLLANAIPIWMYKGQQHGGHDGYCEHGEETDSLDSDASTESASSVATPVSYDRSRRLLVDVNDSTLAQENGNESIVLPSFQVMSSVADKGNEFRRNNTPAHSILSKSLSTDVQNSATSAAWYRDQPRRLPPILPPLQLPDRGDDVHKNKPRRIPPPLPPLSISEPRAWGGRNLHAAERLRRLSRPLPPLPPDAFEDPSRPVSSSLSPLSVPLSPLASVPLYRDATPSSSPGLPVLPMPPLSPSPSPSPSPSLPARIPSPPWSTRRSHGETSEHEVGHLGPVLDWKKDKHAASAHYYVPLGHTLPRGGGGGVGDSSTSRCCCGCCNDHGSSSSVGPQRHVRARARAEEPQYLRNQVDADAEYDELESGRIPASNADPSRQGGFEIDGTDSEWGWYAEKVEGENGKLQFKCKWPIKGAHEGKCGYQAKRQLVQRHIENKHQNFRRFKCLWDGCGQRYGQKSAFFVHWRTHTGEKPIKCKTCGLSFNDPSGHFRHNVTVHGYKAKQRKSNYPNGPPPDDQRRPRNQPVPRPTRIRA